MWWFMDWGRDDEDSGFCALLGRGHGGRPGVRRVTHRKQRFNKALNDCGRSLLEHAEELWLKADGLDTAVRDEVAEGIARIVRAGYDCLASNIPYHTTDAWMAYIDHATAQWFRDRGFAEWFCIAASCGFNSSRPRILAEKIVRVRLGKPARRTRRAAVNGGKK
jgi:hypothetical protein